MDRSFRFCAHGVSRFVARVIIHEYQNVLESSLSGARERSGDIGMNEAPGAAQPSSLPVEKEEGASAVSCGSCLRREAPTCAGVGADRWLRLAATLR
eukprot:5103020-Pleurochrysis_carterae.AAC.1